MESFYHILLIDDEPLTSRVYSYMIKESELGTSALCTDSRLAMGMLRKETYDLVVLDLNMPYVSGKELLEQISLEFPDIPVLILTNEDKVETAVECMKRGAFDFMSKPIDRNRFISALRHALTIRELKRELNILSARREEQSLVQPELFSHIITASPAMRTIFAYIEAIAPSPKAVLITGESGTGKELIARVIHAASSRSGSFVPINVSGLDDTIFSDSLFGHLRGSYTGAEGVRKGLVEQAKDGTLFLDEIGDMDSGPQIKLLRLLQEGEYYPLGSDKPMKSHARIIAATNADLLDGHATGSFRKDLYYRLIAHQIQLPPLRDRMEDLPLLMESFIKDAAQTLQKDLPTLTGEVVDLLKDYSFPGNIRELQAMCFDAVSRSSNRRLDPSYFEALVMDRTGRRPRGIQGGVFRTPSLSAEALRISREMQPEASDADAQVDEPDNGAATGIPEGSFDAGGVPATPFLSPLSSTLASVFESQGLPRMEELEDLVYGLALKKNRGSQTRAAQDLGVSQSTLSRWLKKQTQKT